MNKDTVRQLVLEIVSYPYAWEKCGLDLPDGIRLQLSDRVASEIATMPAVFFGGQDVFMKEAQNRLANPATWEALGLGHLPVGPVGQFCRDRAAHLTEALGGIFCW